MKLKTFISYGLRELAIGVYVTFVRKSKKLQQVLVISAVALAVFSLGYFIGFSTIQTPSFPSNIYFNNLPSTASYVIQTDGTYYWAIRADGKIVFGGANNAGGVSGTDAAAVIQNAINALPNGGLIHIKAGVYYIYKTINVDRPVIIEGEGPDWFGTHGTYLRARVSGHVFNVEFPSLMFMPIIRNMQIESAPGYAGIRLGANVSDPIVENVAIHGGIGVLLEGGVNGWILNSWLESGQYAIYAPKGAKGFLIMGNHFYNLIETAVYFGFISGQNRIVGNLFASRTSKEWIYYDGYELVVEGNTFIGSSYGNAEAYDAIRLVARGRIVIAGNTFDGAGYSRSALRIDGATADSQVIFVNNVVRGFTSSPVYDTGPTWGTRIIRDNLGYPTDTFKSTGLSIPVGTGDAYGSAKTVLSPSGAIRYFKAKINVGGTFGTNETVTVKVEAVYPDGTTAYVEKSFTATGSYWLTDDDILALTKDASTILRLNLYAKTNLSSTSVTISVDVYGHG